MYENKFDGSEILSILFYNSETPAIISDNKNNNNNNGYILVGGNNKNINVWTIKSGEYFNTLREHTDSVTCMAIEQNMLFTGSDDKTIVIWDLVNWYMVGKLEGHQDSKRNIIFIKLINFSYTRLDCASRDWSFIVMFI
jgi:WD40 repeat protein